MPRPTRTIKEPVGEGTIPREKIAAAVREVMAERRSPARLAPGSRVRWTSQGGISPRGSREFTREGHVVAVIEPGVVPDNPWQHVPGNGPFVRMFWGLKPRPEVSYLVLVRPPNGSRAKPRLYWPRAGQLETIED